MKTVKKIYGESVERGLMPAEVKEQQMAKLSQYFASIPRTEAERVVLIDGGIVAMQLMLVARAHGYDTNQLVVLNVRKLLRPSIWIQSVMYRL